MLSMIAKSAALAAILGAGALLAACTTTSAHLSENFGATVKQDMAAQVADPNAHYAGYPAPGSSGPRTALAQTRYDQDSVIRPITTQTSSILSGGGGGGGNGGGGGGGAGASTGASSQ